MTSDFNWNQPVIIVGTLVEKDGRYLFVKEAGGPDKGKWNIPAGKLDSGETLVEGARRETTEETGYECTINSLLGIYRSINCTTRYVFVFIASVGNKKGRIAEDIAEVRWFTRDEVMAMDSNVIRSPRWKEAIDDFESGQQFSLETIREIN